MLIRRLGMFSSTSCERQRSLHEPLKQLEIEAPRLGAFQVPFRFWVPACVCFGAANMVLLLNHSRLQLPHVRQQFERRLRELSTQQQGILEEALHGEGIMAPARRRAPHHSP